MTSSSLVLLARLPGIRTCLGLVVNRAYRIESGRRVAPLPDVVPVSIEPVYAPSPNEGAGRCLVTEADARAVGKPLTDVLVLGSARSLRGPLPLVETGVRVGAARKAVRAVGDRRILVTGGGLSFSAPEPFTEMPVVWGRAYGGRDQHAEQRFSQDERPAPLGGRTMLAPVHPQVTYPRNAAGRGYALDLDRERLHGTSAPNLEDPTDPVTPDRLLSARTTDWIDRPVAACYGPIDLFTFPRAVFFVPPTFDPPERPVHELASGAVLREDLERKFDLRSVGDPRMFNCAPAGLAVCRLEGGERVSLWNMHPRHELLEFDLPDDRPKLTLEPPGVAPRELAPLLQTVLIEPDLDRVTLTWAGVLPVAMPYPDEVMAKVRHAVVWAR